MLKKRLTKQLIQIAYRDIDGFALAQQAAQTAPEFTYGEMCFYSYLKLLDKLNIQKEDVIYELGAGVGKNVLITALYTKAKRIIGIEQLKNLHAASQKSLSRIHNKKRFSYCCRHTQIILKQGDFLKENLDDATIIFINATAFIDDFWESVYQKLLTLKSGTKIAITSKILPQNEFEARYSELLLMTWGYANTFIYQKC